MKVKLKDLDGRRVTIHGIDIVVREPDPHNWWDEASNVHYVSINSQTYRFCEDPDDGYRSYLEDVEIVDRPVKNIIRPVACRCTWNEKGVTDHFAADILTFTDIVSDKTILRVGTGDVYDYYPIAILEWHPENIWYNGG